ncbi:MAG: MBOAT family protein [Cytophagales bacterium]|nr:MAG: MBOAT family protein [Cytophagales bacterium]TAF62074.1 MAG: MBOAT family protein [Cytophagales bacterium]
MFDELLALFTYKENEPLIFTNLLFWYMLGGIMLLYQFIHSRIKVRNLILMLFSVYFYYLSSGVFFALLIFTTVFDYYLGNKIYESESDSTKKFLIALSVTSNLLLLGYFKYTFFIADGLNTAFNLGIEKTNYLAEILNYLLSNQIFEEKSIFLPVGISFYTFQSISYSIDIYRKEIKPAETLTDFAFFVSFFPQLVAGPIVRAHDFIPQIYKPYELSEEDYGRAIFLIINGLVKKVFISDYISINFVDRVFLEPANYEGFATLMAFYGYAIQIYCDFSGYTDMAIGLALLLGFKLNLNFNSPYKALDITDFWRRWHISLSTWLRDYLYVPLGGNRHGNLRTYINLFLVMLLGGLWHGAAWRFVVWGALHGIALAVHKVWMGLTKQNPREPKEHSMFYKLVMGFITFHFVCYCWIYFRAVDIQTAHDMIWRVLFETNINQVWPVLSEYSNPLSMILFGFVMHWLPSEWKQLAKTQFTAVPDIAKAIIIAAVILITFQVKTAEVQPFIYFNF